MKRLLCACVLGLAVFGVAVADDNAMATSGVVERTNCADVAAKIAELSAIESPDDETAAELARLQTVSRRDCVKRATGRRTSGRGAPVAADSVPESTDAPDDVPVASAEDDKTCDTPDEHGCCPGETYTDMGDAGWNCCAGDGQECYPAIQPTDMELSPEEVAKNLDQGLCADGAKPNKFGCCGKEIFKDLGDGVFGCCVPGGECFPPMK